MLTSGNLQLQGGSCHFNKTEKIIGKETQILLNIHC